MYAVALVMLGDADEAADVLNDVFADILGGKTMVPTGCSDGWWVVAVRHRCLNLLSHRSARQRMERQLATDSHIDTTRSEAEIVEAIDNEADRLDRVYQCIDNSLAPQTRRILLMHYRDKKKYRQIASELGISETAVYKHLAKGIKQIKEEIR